VSWSRTSKEEEERTIPVSPPVVKRKIKPMVQRKGTLILILVPKRVLSQEKILTPVGTAITIVAAVKYARVSMSNPTVNMWCAQTTQPRTPITIIA
jgi:hypothetical protein